MLDQRVLYDASKVVYNLLTGTPTLCLLQEGLALPGQLVLLRERTDRQDVFSQEDS